MADSLSWEKIKQELKKIKDVDSLKTELNKLAQEISKIDIQSHLSPSAKEKLAKLESQYNDFLKTVSSAQTQFDKELNKVVGQIKTVRADAEKKLNSLKQMANKQQKTLRQKKAKTKAKATTKKSQKKVASKSTKKKAVRKK